MRLLVVGAGSIGGYFGGRLAQAGRDVTFLVRQERARQLRANGLQIISPYGDITLSPKLVTADTLRGYYDAILLTVKGFALDAALDDIRPAMGPSTVILPVLNGMRHLELLEERFGSSAVGGCICKAATILEDDGRIIQLSKLQDLAYGELDGKPSDRMLALDSFMTDAEFNARLSPVIAREMWEKWILLATVGGINCLMHGTIGEVEAAPSGHTFILQFLDEVTSIVKRVGLPPSDEYFDQIRVQLTQKGSPQTSSMYRDLMKGRRIEVEEIIGDLFRRGTQAGLQTPLLATAYTKLSIYAARVTGS